MTPQEILREEFALLKEDLIENHQKLGMKASGKWINELSDEVIEIGSKLIGRITGASYTRQLVDGRRPGKMPPVRMIEEWIKNKGIQALESRLRLSQMAFAIARKIAQSGTRYYREGGTDLIERVVTPERMQRIIDRVTESVLNDQVDIYVRELRKLEKAA